MDDLAALYKPMMPLVYGSCLKYLRNEADAEDAVMDIFEKIAVKLRKTKIDHFKSWLFIVTKNHCFEKLRQQKNRDPKDLDAAVMYSGQVFHPDSIEDREEKDRLRKCLEQLDHVQHACVDLFYFKKMSYQEIADQLSLQYNQVRSRIQNGRRNLKLCMERAAAGRKVKK